MKVVINKICKAPLVTAVDNLPSVKVMDWTSNSNGLTLALTARHVELYGTRAPANRLQQFQKHDALSSVLRSLASLVSSDSVARRSLSSLEKPGFPCPVRAVLCPVKCRQVTVKKKRVETFRNIRYPVGRI